ncbi:MAG: acyltransferase family protein [Erythrobacter sp.]|uniref:acyltransferase family protein n=1 Tax=Erythrobacter sp. TaxID=1042 RepID=UPI002633552F|nr:acyltransferase family protein [Erythrobacter sp.]MDJ0979653.1 acyltransferase family protein [Erythrobacter sp.]
MQYRPDIEGLRAVAIVPVLLFHAGVDALRGGYVGVDIFFVISGFLITQIILKEIEQGQFSIVRFYQRRVARILPALYFMLAIVSLAVGAVLGLPSEIAKFFDSLAASAAFGSNIYFWSEINYFARSADSLPLLHTWSLGVEEQFYILFPLLLVLLRGLDRRRLAIALSGIAITSLGVGTLVHQSYPEADFYLLPFRAWELLIGSLLALGLAPKLGHRLSTLAAMAGFGLIGVSVLFLVSWLPFPSPLALLPCLGTALLIAYGPGTFAARFLSLAPMRWIGLISFPLYLWHWPIIALYREATGRSLDYRETIALIIASLVAATVSYVIVEKPARNRLRSIAPSTAVGLGAGVTVAALAVGVTLSQQAESIWPVTDRAKQIARYVEYTNWVDEPARDRARVCFINDPSEQLDEQECLTADPGRRNVLIFGDSHAHMHSAALRQRFPEINWLQATHFGCAPLVDGWLHPGCKATRERVLNTLLPSGKIDGVVMASRWRADDAQRLRETIDAIRDRGIDVTVLGPVIEYDGSFPIILARAVASESESAVHSFRDRSTDVTEQRLMQALSGSDARYHSVAQAICPEGSCKLYAPDGGPMIFDYGHLTTSGSTYALRDLPRP